MNPPEPISEHAFLRQAGRILNAGQARTLVLTGNIYDLYGLKKQPKDQSKTDDCDYIPLIDFLTASWNLPDLILVAYELNGPIRFLRSEDRDQLRDAWYRWRVGVDSNELAIKRMLAGPRAGELDQIAQAFDNHLLEAVSNPTRALEVLRQMCLCARTRLGGEPLLQQHLVILIEGADMLIPEAPITSLSDSDRHRVMICHDWFSDPGFVNGQDSVVLIAESRSLIHHRIARLPQLLEVEIPAPEEPVRRHFISWFLKQGPDPGKLKLWGSVEALAQFTAGLSLHALNQLLTGARHQKEPILLQDHVIARVEEYIKSQLGDDIVEFKKPSHRFEDVIGFTQLKRFLREELLPRFGAAGSDALSGAAVCGPIGGGKTFIFEALAAELDMVVLVLKNIRSQWFGQTDVLFERLRRVLNALAKVLIFVDEADTQLGGVGPETHDTERRLTGKIQAMMSDPQMRGRVIWLLITARIHLLSPDLRRPGRVGDLIIPVLDPAGADREEFLKWIVKPVMPDGLTQEQVQRLLTATPNYSTASFASLRAELKAKAKSHQGSLTFDQVLAVVADQIPPAIEDTRRYQTLQALINCTRRGLLPDPNVDEARRRQWAEELARLEAKGIR